MVYQIRVYQLLKLSFINYGLRDFLSYLIYEIRIISTWKNCYKCRKPVEEVIVLSRPVTGFIRPRVHVSFLTCSSTTLPKRRKGNSIFPLARQQNVQYSMRFSYCLSTWVTQIQPDFPL